VRINDTAIPQRGVLAALQAAPFAADETINCVLDGSRVSSPSIASACRKLCGLKPGKPADSNASLKMARIAPALLQCLRARPAAWNWRSGPCSIKVAGVHGENRAQSQGFLTLTPTRATVTMMAITETKEPPTPLPPRNAKGSDQGQRDRTAWSKW
jgi:hypothetical protein